MNRYVSSYRTDYNKIHRGYGFKKKNKARERVHDFVSAYELATMNTFSYNLLL